MRYFSSLFLWLAGASFFIFSFCILVLCLFVLRPERTFAVARILFSILIGLMGIQLEVRGKENIDPEKSYLILGNHQSLFDLFIIPTAIPSCFVGVEAAYHFSIPVWGYLIRKWGNIPIERGKLKSAIQSLERARIKLGQGRSIVILPEGHRTRTGKMGSFKKGPFHLAKAVAPDILPFGIKGLFHYHPKGNFILCPGRVVVSIGKVVGPEEYKDLGVEELRDLMHGRINALI
ncbi:MAG: 1-acyl-sn-glycerol-3-phosphate acyltransferase [Desulfovibrionales bacterium]|nr:1-acyl-sn-glycerol-3-phosphate acyltransferase [Desulfovibrionales bacterium]